MSEAGRARTIDDFAVGDRATVRRRFSAVDVERYAELTGDFNELHVDEAAARRSRFGRRLVHGMLTASLFTRLIGMDLPGRGAIYMQQALRFTAPVFLDDELEGTVEVTAVDRDRRRLTLLTTIKKVDIDVAVVTGEALVMFDPPAN